MEWYQRRGLKTNSTIIYNPIIVPNIGLYDKPEKTVLFVGSNDARKNIPMMLKAFDLFHKKEPEYILKIYGDGFRNDSISPFVSKETIPFIKLMGKNNNWQQLEYNANFYLSSSNYEGMSNSLAESAALGITCIATDCPIGGSKELSQYFKNIFLVGCGDYESMANTMVEHTKDNRISCTSIPDVFSIDQISKKWINFLFEGKNE